TPQNRPRGPPVPIARKTSPSTTGHMPHGSDRNRLWMSWGAGLRDERPLFVDACASGFGRALCRHCTGGEFFSCKRQRFARLSKLQREIMQRRIVAFLRMTLGGFTALTMGSRVCFARVAVEQITK